MAGWDGDGARPLRNSLNRNSCQLPHALDRFRTNSTASAPTRPLPDQRFACGDTGKLVVGSVASYHRPLIRNGFRPPADHRPLLRNGFRPPKSHFPGFCASARPSRVVVWASDHPEIPSSHFRPARNPFLPLPTTGRPKILPLPTTNQTRKPSGLHVVGSGPASSARSSAGTQAPSAGRKHTASDHPKKPLPPHFRPHRGRSGSHLSTFPPFHFRPHRDRFALYKRSGLHVVGSGPASSARPSAGTQAPSAGRKHTASDRSGSTKAKRHSGGWKSRAKSVGAK